ncbi:MAG: hypothetical protein LDL14_09750, partial [Nitrospira sp.]|nr:hypothetical protein [Nitrospira sp.]
SGPIKRSGTAVPSNSARNSQPRWLDFRGALQVAAAALVSGCATMSPQCHVDVDSISSEWLGAKKTYILLPGNEDTSAEDLQFKEFATYVHRALATKGFVRADSIEKAELVVFLAYGIGDPKEHLDFAPGVGQTGVSSSTTFGTLSTYGGYGTYSGTTTYTPTYGVTRCTTHVGSYTIYFRFMLLDAYDLETYRKEKKFSQLWRATVTSTGSSDDLRRVFPILVTASKTHLGSNTGQKVRVVIHEEDAAVLEIKGVKPEPAKPTQ